VEIGADAAGRLRVRSPYQNLDGLDEDGWQRSDDAIEILSEGGFQLLGRLDRVVKIEDKRVSLDEVERALQRLEAVREAAVIKLQRGQRLELGAVLVLSGQGRAALAQQRQGQFTLSLRRALRGQLQPLAIPRRFRFAEAIPTNLQGKRLVTELEKLFA
jgi:acyl-coenzyme A synthetase/AMP-(fatty) acid ligase